MESAQDVKKVVQDTISAFGGIDIIIANAGWTRFSNFLDLEALEDEEWDKVCLSCMTDYTQYHIQSPKVYILIASGMASQRQIATSSHESSATTFHQERRRWCVHLDQQHRWNIDRR